MFPYMIDAHHIDVLKVFDLENRSWTKLPGHQQPSNVKMLTEGERIYFYGNISFDFHNIIDIFDTKTGVWSKVLQPEDRAFYAMSIEKQTKSLVVTGGLVGKVYDGSTDRGMVMSDDLLIYNTGKKTWKQAKLKTARYGQTTQFINGQFIVHGGNKIFNDDFSGKIPTEIYSTEVISR
jgi:hypothetical protein